MAGIGLDQLGDELLKIIEQYGAKAREAIEGGLAGLAVEMRDEIEASSPVLSASSTAGKKYRKRRGRYRKGWQVKEVMRYGKKFQIIHNKTDWTLTHLLEKGAIRTKQGVMPPKPHMAPTFDKMIEPFMTNLKQKLGG